MRARSISALGVAVVAAIGGFIGGCEILTGSLDEQCLDGGSEAPVDASVVRVDASVSSDAGSGPEAQASSALAYCDEAWELLMRRLPACYGGDRGYFERLADAYGVSCEAGADAVRTGRYSFTESKARDCLERMSMVSCPELTRSGVFAAIWCSDLLVGAVDEGDGCSDSDCRPGLACDLALLHGTDSVEPIPGTCTIRCVDAGGRQGLGAPCPRGSVDCGPGLLCRAPTEDPAAAPRCLALPRAGERCRSDVPCASGAYCGEAGLCVAVHADGEACPPELTLGDVCEPGSRCVRGDGGYVCLPDRRIGETCGGNVSPSCGRLAWCDEGTCATLRFVGEACGPAYSCVRSYCDPSTRRCAASKADGAPCGDTILLNECQGYCGAEGTCTSECRP